MMIEQDLELINDEKLFKNVLSSAEKVYKKYKFLDISRSDFLIIVKDIVNNNKYGYDKSLGISYVEFFEEKIDEYLVCYLKNILLSDEGVNFLDNYIKSYMKISRGCSSALKELKKLFDILSNMDCFLTFELCSEIIRKNEVINSNLKVVIEKNYLC